ncbi:hypothetical protein FDECE_14205 [Fusarium decemcellulare]|nr:hypothetical protein FDECE_14205 [Fusarium decemcellulare]
METITIMSRQELEEHDLADIATACNVSREQIDDVYACTPLQIATVAESTIHAGASVFQFIFNLSPSIDQDRFCSSLQRVVSQNAVLRTRLVSFRRGLVQVVTNEQHSTRRLPAATGLQEYLREDKEEPLGLGAPLFRTALVGNKFILTIHHSIMDHASLTPLFQDIMGAYHEQEPLKRAEFKEFVQHCLNIDSFAANKFWASHFTGTPTIFPKVDQGHIPFATPAMSRSIVLDRIGADVPSSYLPSYIEVAWALTASVYTGNDSNAFGLIFSGRNSACSAAETTLGPTIAIVPVQVKLEKNTTVEEILKARATARRQLQRDPSLQYGVPKIRTVSEAARVASGFQTVLNIRPRWYDPKESSEVTYDEMKEPGEPFALVINCDLEDNGVSVQALVDLKVIPEQQLRRILNQFEHFLRSLTEATPNTKLQDIRRLSGADISEIMDWNSALLNRVDEGDCIHELFRAQARQRPEYTAVEAWDGTVTYRELDDMSDRLAHELRQRGVSAGSLVAFIFEKSLWTVVALLGIMKAGGACVPISTADPPARKAAIISSAGITMIVTSSAEYESSAQLSTNVMEVSPSTIAGLSDGLGPLDKETYDASALAFVVYTSGSTGTPKGVMLQHNNLVAALTAFIQRLEWKPRTRMLQFASYVWDAHIGETFGALLSGGCLCIPSEEDRKSRLVHCFNSGRIDCAWLTPTVIRTLSPEEVPNLKMLWSIGEPIASDAARTWGKSLRLINGWGPCEGSIISAIAELTPESPYPEAIGTPLNNALWIVNPKNTNELLPIGSVGEILIDGTCVARGYLKDEIKTKASFIKPPSWAPCPKPKDKERRLYRTGDLAKYNPDGSIVFIGRQDTQVKIRGQRLELGEIESVLSSCSEIRDAMTTTKIVDGRTHLIAIVTLTDARLPREGLLREVPSEYRDIVVQHLQAIGQQARSSLSSYMVPTVWLAVEKMPRVESAKLDRVAISQWLKDKERLSSVRAAMAMLMNKPLEPPQTTEELLLQSVWASVLDIPTNHIGRESSFIALGGDSILAMQAAAQCLRQRLATTTAVLLQNTSLAAIAEAAVKLKGEAGYTALSKSGSQNGQVPSPAILSHLSTLKIPYLRNDNVEAAVPCTDGQLTMLAVSETGRRGYCIDFELYCNSSLDTKRLRNACEQVIKRHGILRTVFVQHDQDFYQVALKDLPPTTIIDEVAQAHVSGAISFRQGVPLGCFHLMSDGRGGCQSLRLEIHHALYDAISLGLIFRDLDAAYRGNILPDRVDFHTWISHTGSLDMSQSREFWKKVLQESSMPYLVPVPVGAIRGHPLDKQVELRVPLKAMTAIPTATPSSLVKAAWSLLLSRALGIRDVVFGEVVANRSLPIPGIDQVQGPCVNMVPVRSHLNPSMTLAELVARIHDLHTDGMPHHHLGTRSIIQECTTWPSWTRFSTAIVYQNHASLGKTVKIGDNDCALSVHGLLGDSTDIHLIATPDPDRDELEVALRYSSLTFPAEQINWIAQAFEGILHLMPSALQQTVNQVETALDGILDSSYVIPATPQKFDPLSSGTAAQQERTAPEEAQETVSQVWSKLRLLPRSRMEGEDCLMWDCGADIVTTLLLSEQYRALGYNISPMDVINNPTKSMQAIITGTKKLVVDGEI